MLAVFAVTFFYIIFVWLVFFRFKLLRLTPSWGVVTGFVFLHLVLVPLVGMRFVAPYTEDVRLIRNTVQITPRLPEPTLVEQVLVREGQHVKKGDLLFQLDRRTYQFQVDQARAALEAAKQNVIVLAADITVAQETVARTQAELAFKKIEAARYTQLASQKAAPEANAQRWTAEVAAAEAAVAEAQADVQRAQAAYGAEIDGVNVQVIQAQSELDQALFYLAQTEIRAPEDGMIVNLQVQPGMVAGIVRLGAIASFISDRNPYLLAMYRQENLLFVKPGQEVVMALNLYPGRHYKARVKDVWWASGRGQLLPSGQLPVFQDAAEFPEARLAVQLELDDPALKMEDLPIGAEGAAMIVTNAASPFTWVGQIALRTYTWGRFIYPLPF